MNTPWSFCICSNGGCHLNKCIDSIVKNNIKKYEIIVCQDNNTIKETNEIKLITINNVSNNIHICKKKNLLIKNSLYENLCIMHDYMCLDENWANGYESYGNSWNVCTNIIKEMGTGMRGADWIGDVTCPAWETAKKSMKTRFIPYDKYFHKNQWISGHFFCVKKSFIIDNNLWLDENILWGNKNTPEYQEWCLRVKNNTHLSINTKSIALTQKEKKEHRLKHCSNIDIANMSIYNGV
jgi:hypothetical protein